LDSKHVINSNVNSIEHLHEETITMTQDGVESGKTGSETQAAPEAPSTQASDQQPSQGVDLVAQVLENEQFKSELVEAIKRQTQATKDRRINRLDRKITDIVERLNLTPQQQQELEKQTLLERVAQLEEQSSPEGSTEATVQPTASPDYVNVFEKAGIDPNSPEAMQMAETHKNNPLGLATAILERASQPPKQPPPAAAATQPGGGTSTPSESDDALVSRLSDLVADVANYAKHKPEIDKIRADMAVRGINR
jgi:hypothetical protein